MVLMLLVPTIATADLIDFEFVEGRDFEGPVDGFFYTAYDGLIVLDSDPFAFASLVNLMNPANESESRISGYYVNVGAFVGVPTFIEFWLSAWSIAFDFATPSGIVQVSAWDGSGALLVDGRFAGNHAFLTPAGHFVSAGEAELVGHGKMSKVRVAALPGEGLIVDNLDFVSAGRDGGTSIPEPWGLSWLALVFLAARRRL